MQDIATRVLHVSPDWLAEYENDSTPYGWDLLGSFSTREEALKCAQQPTIRMVLASGNVDVPTRYTGEV